MTIGDTNPDFFDILIGADFFASHHVLISNSQRRLYFTFNGGRVFSPHRVSATAKQDATIVAQ